MIWPSGLESTRPARFETTSIYGERFPSAVFSVAL
jgi:hypothetical protein